MLSLPFVLSEGDRVVRIPEVQRGMEMEKNQKGTGGC
jgi:hypothetical protein